MKGFNVLHPIAWDAFGLPAEQYAIQTGTHPALTTANNINRFREQLQALGEDSSILHKIECWCCLVAGLQGNKAETSFQCSRRIPAYGL